MYAYMDSKHKLDVDKILVNGCVDHWFVQNTEIWFDQNTEMLFDNNNLDIVVSLLVSHGYKCKVEEVCGGTEQLSVTMD